MRPLQGASSKVLENLFQDDGRKTFALKWDCWHMNLRFHDISAAPKCFRVCHIDEENSLILVRFIFVREESFRREFSTENPRTYARLTMQKTLSKRFNALFIGNKKERNYDTKRLLFELWENKTRKNIKNCFQHCDRRGSRRDSSQTTSQRKMKNSTFPSIVPESP